MRILVVASLSITAFSFGCSAMPAASSPAAGEATVAIRPQAPAQAAAESRPPAEEADADAEAALDGDEIGTAFGSGGLGLAGVGEGGGGTGEGTIGLGNVGTLGHGGGTGTGQGYGSGAGRGGGSTPRGKVAGATATTTGGGLPPEVIRRVIRQHVGPIRLCYENALAKAPALAGKVAVSFTIGAQGNVTSVAASDTNIGNAEMVACVLAAMKRMSFPAPEGGGTVIVTYPFNFSPSDS